MRKVALVQSCKAYSDVVPVFCKEILKHDIFDAVYVVTNADKFKDLDPRCHVIYLKKDKGFGGNIAHVLAEIPEDVIFLACEDMIFLEPQQCVGYDETFQHVLNNSDVGALRLSWGHKKVKFAPGVRGKYRELHRKYQYLISLQPSWWRKDFLKRVLKLGENAFHFETWGSKRAKNFPDKKLCVDVDVAKYTNFFMGGKINEAFIDYAEKHGITLTQTQLSVRPYVSKQPVPYKEFMEQRQRAGAYTK